jgi:hypothetical protein
MSVKTSSVKTKSIKVNIEKVMNITLDADLDYVPFADQYVANTTPSILYTGNMIMVLQNGFFVNGLT